MKKQIIWAIIIVVAITFVGLLFIQVIYLRNSIEIHEHQFTQGVRSTLVYTGRYLEQEEIKYFLNETPRHISAESFNTRQNGNIPGQEGVNLKFTTATGLEADLNIRGTADELSNIQGESSIFMGGHYRNLSEAYRESYLYHKGVLDDVIFSIISSAADRPITVRADSAMVSRYLRERLDTFNIKIPYEFAVVDATGVPHVQSDGYAPREGKDEVFTQPLFVRSPTPDKYYLKVYFPEKGDYIYEGLYYMIPAFIFTIILIAVFVFTILAAFREKRLNELKNDFINNMTHEFKTPLSSISLAAQMLNDSDIRKSPGMLQQISQVVSDESKRLRYQVDKVLQMALFEREEVRFKMEEVDVNSLLFSATNTSRMRVESHGGKLTANLDAESPIVKVDYLHLTNVIFNLLDNAIKYRDDNRPLEVTVTTRNIDGERLEIEVADNGIGIRQEHIKRIFDKFYRVPTGNVHNVKGFGLGLAYVKRVIKEFGGTITTESEPEKGTIFTIILPLSTD